MTSTVTRDYVDLSPAEQAERDAQASDAVILPRSIARVVERIKKLAERKITTPFPTWKQQNMTTRGVQLLVIKDQNGSWTAPQQTEMDNLTANWIWIKQVRDWSDSLEAGIPTDTQQNILNYDITSGWPS